MSAAEELRAMAARGELEPIEPSAAAAEDRLVSASRSLATCREIAESDPRSCLLLAWDGVAFPILAAALALAGYRVTSRQGHHRVAVEAGRLLLGEDALLSRIGGLRRSRDRTMYEQDRPDPADVADFLQDLEQLRTLVGAALERARSTCPASSNLGSPERRASRM